MIDTFEDVFQAIKETILLMFVNTSKKHSNGVFMLPPYYTSLCTSIIQNFKNHPCFTTFFSHLYRTVIHILPKCFFFLQINSR